MKTLKPFLILWAALSGSIIALIVFIERRRPTCKIYTGNDAAAVLIQMYQKHGPLRMLIEEKDDEPLWPNGQILEGVEVQSAGFYPSFTDFNDITYYASVDVVWKSNRPIRTGLSRRIFGP